MSNDFIDIASALLFSVNAIPLRVYTLKEQGIIVQCHNFLYDDASTKD